MRGLRRPKIQAYGARAFLCEWDTPSEALTRFLWHLYRHWRQHPRIGIADLILGQKSVVVCGVEGDMTTLQPAHIEEFLCETLPLEVEEPCQTGPLVVSVIYDGPDLAEVATRLAMSPDKVVTLHTAQTYQVGWMGFLPGFAYLLGLDPQLALPRRFSVRPHLPAGAVAIADQMSAIYPMASPGGWHWLGHTREALWNPHATTETALTRLAPGDWVRFEVAYD